MIVGDGIINNFSKVPINPRSGKKVIQGQMLQKSFFLVFQLNGKFYNKNREDKNYSAYKYL